MFDPWGALRARADVTLSWVRMPDGRPGRTDGVGVVWLDKRLQQDERRCTITHELVHLERGHAGCQRPAIECRVRAEAARRLIDIEDLCRHAAWACSIHELAGDLWVTPDVVRDRLTSLTPAEAARLAQVEHQTR